MLKKQSIRKEVKILVNNEQLEKEEIIKLSEDWNEAQEKFFKKMLKQGGQFKLNGYRFNVTPKPQMVTSKGEKDKGVIIVPGIDERF
jgi:hypothetical protein|tara:strand:- start:233 stop:493 length:261 start_codon:yes stop_codon:yes gene_type:complete